MSQVHDLGIRCDHVRAIFFGESRFDEYGLQQAGPIAIGVLRVLPFPTSRGYERKLLRYDHVLRAILIVLEKFRQILAFLDECI